MRPVAYFIALLLPAAAGGAVVRLEVADRSPVLAGKSFGRAGAYERVVGKAWFAVSPTTPMNRRIEDIQYAPRNADGLVEFSADLYMLRPQDRARSNGTVLFEVTNRGGKGMLATFNRASGSLDPRAEADFGDGFLLERGFTLVWLGWQPDLAPKEHALRLYAPVATKGGQPITGRVRTDFVADAKTNSFPIAEAGHIAYPPAADAAPVLTVRDGIDGARESVQGFRLAASGKVMVDAGLTPGRIYELTYTARDPFVGGLGFAAVRDLIAYLKSDGTAKFALGFGSSQSAMYLKGFLHEGFNQDENGRRVFDGMYGHVAGGRTVVLNRRFAQPARTAGPFRAFFSGSDEFPFSDREQKDPVTGKTDGVLTKASEGGVVPKIFYSNSSYEYWGSAGSLAHSSLDGKRDVELPSTTRLLLFAGGQHGPAAFPPPHRRTQNFANPNDYRWSMRALLVALHRWVTEGTVPPDSQYPRIAADQLVPFTAVQFPRIPGVSFPTHMYQARRLDFEREPPLLGKPFVALLPQVDRDGNDASGLRMPEVSVPLATYTGWNLRAAETGAPQELVNSTGSWIPFARTRAERDASHDPRVSIEERYGNRERYLEKMRSAAEDLAAHGYLLREDIGRVVDLGAARWDYLMKPGVEAAAK